MDLSGNTLPTTSAFTSLSNKIQYLIAKNTSDPNADAYAASQAAQAEQDAKVRRQEAAAAAAASEDATKQAESQAAAADLAARSKFNSKKLLNESAKGILTGFGSLIILCFVLYGGHIAVNQVIGYNVPFRILTFIYGAIFSIWFVPKALYDKYWSKKELPYYAFFPISTYVPNGALEKLFIGSFCYTEDETTRAARVAVETLYSEAFKKSVTGVVSATAATVAAVGTLASVAKVKPQQVITPKPTGHIPQEPPKPTETIPQEPPKTTEPIPQEPPKPTETIPQEPPKPTEPIPQQPPKPTEPKSDQPIARVIPPKPTGPKPEEVKPAPHS